MSPYRVPSRPAAPRRRGELQLPSENGRRWVRTVALGGLIVYAGLVALFAGAPPELVARLAGVALVLTALTVSPLLP